MKSLAASIPLMLTGAVLSAMAILLGAIRLEYCGQPEALRPRNNAPNSTETDSPTLAPPGKVVFLQIEADKPDLEIGWMENW